MYIVLDIVIRLHNNKKYEIYGPWRMAIETVIYYICVRII